MTNATTLRRLLEAPGLLEVPGCYDAFSARLVERAGHPVAYMTGFGASASRLGAPDVGLLSFKEAADHAAALAAAISIPLMADADTGYGNVANVQRTVRTYARAGVAGIQIEDQVWPKRCGHTEGKRVLARADAVAKIRAAAAARDEGGADIVIIARTDARATDGLDEALERCKAFADAGADVVFLEAPRSEDEIRKLVAAVDAPLLLNQIEGGATPVLPREEIEALGFKIALYPLTLLSVVAAALTDHLAGADGFRRHSGAPTFEELRDLVGFPAYDELVQRFGV